MTTNKNKELTYDFDTFSCEYLTDVIVKFLQTKISIAKNLMAPIIHSLGELNSGKIFDYNHNIDFISLT